MSEIPEDVRHAAIEVLGRMNMLGPIHDIECVAHAIMAERDRCAKIAEADAAALDNPHNHGLGFGNDLVEVATDIAAAIRNPPKPLKS